LEPTSRSMNGRASGRHIGSVVMNWHKGDTGMFFYK
jgi:hypothetical protein